MKYFKFGVNSILCILMKITNSQNALNKNLPMFVLLSVDATALATLLSLNSTQPSVNCLRPLPPPFFLRFEMLGSTKKIYNIRRTNMKLAI